MEVGAQGAPLFQLEFLLTIRNPALAELNSSLVWRWFASIVVLVQ